MGNARQKYLSLLAVWSRSNNYVPLGRRGKEPSAYPSRRRLLKAVDRKSGHGHGA